MKEEGKTENDTLGGAPQKKEAWWQPAIKIFSQVSAWVVVPILIALFLGKILDSHFGTKPWIFLIFSGISFLVSSFGIVRTVKAYMKNLNLSKNTDK